MKIRHLYLIIILLLYSTFLEAEEIKVYKVKPFIIEKSIVFDKFVGKYYSENMKCKSSNRIFKYTNINGDRIVLDDNGVIEIIQSIEKTNITEMFLSNRVIEYLNSINALIVLKSNIKFEYIKNGNNYIYRGRKIINGFEVKQGDLLEISASENANMIEVKFYLLWYFEQGASDELFNSKISKYATESNYQYDIDSCYYKNGWYYLHRK